MLRIKLLLMISFLPVAAGCKVRKDTSETLFSSAQMDTFESCSETIGSYLAADAINCAGLSGKCRALFLPQNMKREDDPVKYDSAICTSAKKSALIAMTVAACNGKPDKTGNVATKKFTTNMELCPLTDTAATSAGWEQDGAKPEAYHPGATVCYRKTTGTSVIAGVPPANQCCYGPASEPDFKAKNYKLITSGNGAGTPDLASTVGTMNKFRFGMSHLVNDVCTFELMNYNVNTYHFLGWGPHHPANAPENTGGFNAATQSLHEWFSRSERVTDTAASDSDQTN